MNDNNNNRVVVCAANRSRVTKRIVCGARHWDKIMRSQALGDSVILTPEWLGAEQGFIDQRGEWMTRQEAWLVAEAACQIKHIHTEGTLYSEDLY